MIEIKGAYNTALCYCQNLEEGAAKQIKAVCDREYFTGSSIRIMPDVHAGMGCTIGTTMTIADKVVPGMVGVDIGCGMETVKVSDNGMEFEKLDKLIRENIPSGSEVRKHPHAYSEDIDLSGLRCVKHVNIDRAYRSIGTLGGGNHFIEVDKDEDGSLYIVVHSGSRHIGREVAEYYQEEGYRALCGGARYQIDEMIQKLKESGQSGEIQRRIEEAREKRPADVPKDLAFVEGALFDDYIHDMRIIQRFASLNRKAMMDVILKGMKLDKEEEFTTIHNYIDTDSMILRKGAVSARKDEKLLIPINMRDGSLICTGKGNKEWNYSAPHGAGRLMSRKAARERLSLQQFRGEMEGIYTTSVCADTLDESPMAYKDMGDIVSQIGPTAQILSVIKPVYNFKAAE